MKDTVAIILAAGLGSRMKSDRPKGLHAVAGLPLVYWPVKAALDAGCSRVAVVVGHGADEVEACVRGLFPPDGEASARDGIPRTHAGAGSQAPTALALLPFVGSATRFVPAPSTQEDMSCQPARAFFTFAKAFIAKSRCSRVWAAEICTRMRALPLGTTG